MFQKTNKCVKKKGKLIPKYRWKRDISLHFGLKDPNYIGGARNDDVTRMVQKIIIHHDYDVKGILFSYLSLYWLVVATIINYNSELAIDKVDEVDLSR